LTLSKTVVFPANRQPSPPPLIEASFLSLHRSASFFRVKPNPPLYTPRDRHVLRASWFLAQTIFGLSFPLSAKASTVFSTISSWPSNVSFVKRSPLPPLNRSKSSTLVTSRSFDEEKAHF